MKYPHSGISVPALVLMVTFVSSSATESRILQSNQNERIVNGVIYVDESHHINKNCNDTDIIHDTNRLPIPARDATDVIVVEHEDDHTRCRDGSCGHYQPDSNRGGAHSSGSSSIQNPTSHDSDIHVSVNPGTGIIPGGNGGGQIKVVGGGHRTNGGNTIIHVIGSRPENYEGYIPDSWLRDTSPIGDRSSQVSGDAVIQFLKNAVNLNGGGITGNRDLGNKYLQVRPGADSNVYHIKGSRGVYDGQGARGPRIRVVKNHNLPSRIGFDSPDSSVVPTGRRRIISLGGSNRGSHRGGYYGGNRNPVSLSLLDSPDRGHSGISTYPAINGGFTGGLSGGDGTIEIIDSRDGIGSQGYGNIDLEDGYAGYGNGRYIEDEDGSAYDEQIYVPGVYENGNYVPAHYDTIHEYLRHHI